MSDCEHMNLRALEKEGMTQCVDCGFAGVQCDVVAWRFAKRIERLEKEYAQMIGLIEKIVAEKNANDNAAS